MATQLDMQLKQQNTAALEKIAYEQRTANLLKMRELQGQAIASGWPVTDAVVKHIQVLDEQITERLGLE